MSEQQELADLDAERAVLCACLIDDGQSAGTYALASQYVRITAQRRDDGVMIDGDFADQRHNVMFAAMGEILRRGEHLDMQSLAAELRMMARWNTIGGPMYLSEVMAATMTTAHVETHARIVRREADRRRVDLALARARRALRSSTDPDASMSAALDLVAREVEAGSVRGGPRPLMEHCEGNWKQLEERMSGAAPTPITLGLDGLDRVTGGAFAGQVVIVAGVQGRGKTSWLAQMLKANARRFLADARGDIRASKRVAWWSLEMPASEIVWRHAGWDAGIQQGALRSGRLNQSEINGVADSFNAMSALPIDLDGESAPTALDIRAWLYAHRKTKLAAVDWLGCLQPHPHAPKGSKPHEHAELNMQTLAMTARQLGITIVIPNQFTQAANRGSEQSMHDMLGGAAVVNYAAIVAVMRPGDAMAGDDLPVSIRVEKSRMSSNVVVEAVFRRATGTFVEREHERAQNVTQLPAPRGRSGKRDVPRQTVQWQYGDDAPADDARESGEHEAHEVSR